jgi:hypothetical protein
LSRRWYYLCRRMPFGFGNAPAPFVRFSNIAPLERRVRPPRPLKTNHTNNLAGSRHRREACWSGCAVNQWRSPYYGEQSSMSLIIHHRIGARRREGETIALFGVLIPSPATSLIGTADQPAKKRMSFQQPQNETIPSGPFSISSSSTRRLIDYSGKVGAFFGVDSPRAAERN